MDGQLLRLVPAGTGADSGVTARRDEAALGEQLDDARQHAGLGAGDDGEAGGGTGEGVFRMRIHGTAPSRQSWSDERQRRSEEHTSELQSLMRISYACICLH